VIYALSAFLKLATEVSWQGMRRAFLSGVVLTELTETRTPPCSGQMRPNPVNYKLILTYQDYDMSDVAV